MALLELIDEHGFAAWSVAAYCTGNLTLVCPPCGRQWMKLRVDQGSWGVHRHPCERCPPINDYLVPGSVEEWLAEIPDELLEREFLLNVAHFRRFYAQEKKAEISEAGCRSEGAFSA